MLVFQNQIECDRYRSNLEIIFLGEFFSECAEVYTLCSFDPTIKRKIFSSADGSMNLQPPCSKISTRLDFLQPVLDLIQVFRKALLELTK